MSSNQLNSLLQGRIHGAVNIRGVRFQILFGLWQAMQLYDANCPFEAVGLERIEDVDLYPKPLQLIKNQSVRYYQAKTSEGNWVPSQLSKPLRSFLEILRADPDGRFVLVFNFEPRGEVGEMANFHQQKASKQKAIRQKFRNLCHKAGQASKEGRIPALNVTDAEADALWERLEFVTHAEDDVVQSIKERMTDNFAIAGGRVEEYLAVFFYHFALWSKERRRVVRADLDDLHDRVGSNAAFERAFAARGSLLKPVDWTRDAELDDFREGKQTRAGHIEANLDVARPRWHEAIKAAFKSRSIVVVRASSGQGKSTLALRFAHDEWFGTHTFSLLSAGTKEEAELVCEALRHRVQSLQLPTFLLIDNASRRTQHWSRVAQECAHLGIPTLITLRQEDWVRFAEENLFSSAPIEPLLERSEAREIFKSLHTAGRIHPDVLSPDWAWERIGEPRLLLEYVYLLTHGKMLEERLREQLEEIRRHESPLKLEILRRVVMADALGAPLDETRLFEDLRREWGPAEVAAGAGALLSPMNGEYLQRFDNRVYGLHWVRSDHLVRLLHDGYPTPAQTTLSVLSAMAPESLSDAIASALLRPDIEKKTFMDGLIHRARNAPLSEFLASLKGIFEFGEVAFIEANRSLFNEALALGGQNGPMLLSYDWPPALGIKLLQDMARATADIAGNNLQKVAAISRRFRQAPRGQDECRQFLQNVVPMLDVDRLETDIGETGELLAWLGWCGVSLTQWPQIQLRLLERALRWDYQVESLCRFHEGLWLFDRATYRDWIMRAPEELRDYIQWQLDCLELHLPTPQNVPGFSEPQGAVELEYLGRDFDKANADSVGRIQKLYSLFPFYAHYNAHAFWALQWPVSHDPSFKQMTQYAQHLRFHVAHNSAWVRIIEARFGISTFYEFQAAWHNARQKTIAVLDALTDRLELLLAGKVPDLLATFSGTSDIQEFERALIQVPTPPEKTPGELKEKLKAASEWNSHMTAWLSAFVNTAVFFQERKRLPQLASGNLLGENEAQASHLCLHNFRDAAKDLGDMQESMGLLFDLAGDAFATRDLAVKERHAFERAAKALEVWLEDRPTERVPSLDDFLESKRKEYQCTLSARLHNALAPLEEKGMVFGYPSGICEVFPFSFLPLLFEVRDPCNFLDERDAVFAALEQLQDMADFGCLIPTFGGDRFLPGGFRTTLRFPAPDDKDGWKTREAVLLDVQTLPEGVWELLPNRPLREYSRLTLKATLHALLLKLESFARIHERTGRLSSIPGRFTRQLFERNRDDLLVQPIGEGVNFDQIEDLMMSECASYRDTTDFARVGDMLRSLRSWSDLQKKLQEAKHESSISNTSSSDLNELKNTLWEDARKFTTMDFKEVHHLVLQLTIGEESKN